MKFYVWDRGTTDDANEIFLPRDVLISWNLVWNNVMIYTRHCGFLKKTLLVAFMLLTKHQVRMTSSELITFIINQIQLDNL